MNSAPVAPLRNERALDRMAAEVKDVVLLEFDADRIDQPPGGRERPFYHRAHDGGVAQVVAALHRVLEMELDRVVRDAEFSLHPVVGRGVFRSRNEGVAAHGRHLLQHHDLGPRIVGRHRRGKARAAGTDHHDVVDEVFGNARLARHDDGRRRELHAGLLRRGRHGAPERVRRQRRSRYRVDLHGIRSDHRIAHFRVDLAGQNRVFAFLHDVDLPDLAAVERDGHREVTVTARGRPLRRDGGGEDGG